jgi:hypothetical protein
MVLQNKQQTTCKWILASGLISVSQFHSSASRQWPIICSISISTYWFLIDVCLSLKPIDVGWWDYIMLICQYGIILIHILWYKIYLIEFAGFKKFTIQLTFDKFIMIFQNDSFTTYNGFIFVLQFCVDICSVLASDDLITELHSSWTEYRWLHTIGRERKWHISK